MIIYENTHPGTRLDADDLSNLMLSNETIFGYFTKEDIQKTMLDFRDTTGATNRPGIRVYRTRNAGNTSTLQSIVAVAVKTDGFDAVPFPQNAKPWLRSQTTRASGDNSSLNIPATVELTFTNAFRLSRDGGLTAFFSEAMLRPLLDDASIDGISFYEVPLDNVDSNKLSDKIDDGTGLTQAGLTSYLAVGTRLVGGEIQHDQARMTNNVLSDLPCPGYCLSLTTTTASVANTDIDFNGPPYLVKWEKT
jgi:hypothetical protein